MSTGADARTMPITPEYADGHARVFGNRGPQRGFWVMRCERCHGVQLAEMERRYDCGDCGGKDCRGSVNLNEAPPLPPAAVNAPILAGRFYENTIAIDGKTDIGSRRKYNEYLKQNEYCHAGDFSPQYIAKEKAQREAKDRAETRETVARLVHERWKP